MGLQNYALPALHPHSSRTEMNMSRWRGQEGSNSVLEANKGLRRLLGVVVWACSLFHPAIISSSF
jgi:hypothetical protein